LALPLIAALLALEPGWLQAQGTAAGLPVVRVGVVYDGPPTEEAGIAPVQSLELFDLIRTETAALTEREFDVRFPADKQLTAGWSRASSEAALDRLLADPKVDVVLAIGVFGTMAATRRTSIPKPLLGTWGIDSQAQDLPIVGNTTGVDNLNYIILPGSVRKDLRKFKEVIHFSTVHVIHDSLVREFIPKIEEYARAAGDDLDIEIVLVPVDRSVDEALAALPSDTEAVYVTPLNRITAGGIDRLIAALAERRLPSMALEGRRMVERGILMGLRAETDLRRRARRVALNIQQSLLGRNPGDLPVTLDLQEALVINAATARAIGLSFPWRVTIEAEMLGEGAEGVARTLSLTDVVGEAVAANLALRAADRRVAAGAEDIRLARSLRRPQLDAFAEGVEIDDDRARASFGSQAERTGSIGLILSQTIFSDDVNAGVTIAEDLQLSRERDWERQRLDVALQATVAFLNVLRAETRERVERENLKLTESNLDLARRRLRAGQTGKADVYRWESQLATDRSDVIGAGSDVLAARAVLNRVLNRPLEELFGATPAKLEDPDLITSHERLYDYVGNPMDYGLFREFSVEEGLANSFELQALDASIAAQERSYLAAKRSYWSPDISLFGQVDRQFSRSGDGSDPPSIPMLPFEPPDRENWTVGIQATLPLLTGSARRSEVEQSSQDLAALRVERAALAQTIELDIRTVLFDAGSTYPAIELAHEAAEAARQNLILVTDSYSRGLVSIIDLLDAQNAALVAELFAANSVFDFLIDLMRVQRTTSTFDFFASAEGRAAWFERLEAFFRQRRSASP
jgi:outer membrane protein TolC